MCNQIYLGTLSGGISKLGKAGAEMIRGVSVNQSSSFNRNGHQQSTYSTLSKLPLSFKSQLEQIEIEINLLSAEVQDGKRETRSIKANRDVLEQDA
jgi:hypothetical protein